MLRINQCKVEVGYTIDQVKKKVCKIIGCPSEAIKNISIVKESLDARKKPALFYSLVVDVCLHHEKKYYDRLKGKDVHLVEDNVYQFPSGGTQKLETRPVIVGAGPAGLVCAYYLSLYGYKPIVFERGKCVEERKKDIDTFWETGVLNTKSNVQFGEGGAGTFSDGKLNTLVKDKNGRCHEILKLFVKMGAPADIVYKQKPHVGTDLLMDMVKNLRLGIIEHGGEVRFQSQVTDFLINDGKIKGIVINGVEKLQSDLVVLAIGHSARDTFETIYKAGMYMEAKAFAVGYRVQHKQRIIDISQYGKQSEDVYEELGAASYKLTAKTSSGRGVYSFCMCPGGYVVNASSEDERTAINGMSYHSRDSHAANSAIIISVTPADFRDKSPLGGVEFQRELEHRTYQLAGGKIPVQLLGDFKKNKISEMKSDEDLPLKIKGLFEAANVRSILPEEMNAAFLEGMESFGNKIKGFDADHTVVAGIESRTSSPVRIKRDEDGVASIKGIYPCGEGAGYAGGISSAAMDGLYVAEQIVSHYNNENIKGD